MISIAHPGGSFIYLVLSSDNKKIMSNGWGSFIHVTDCEKDGKQVLTILDIVKESGWLNFELSPDGNILI